MNKRAILFFTLVTVLLVTGAGDLFAQAGARGRTRGPASYTVTVQSNVSQAGLSIDNAVQKAAWPYSIELPAGAHTFRVTASGYYDWEQTIDIQSNQTVTANLNPIVFNLSVSSNVPARVLLNGDDSGPTTFQRQLSPGSYNITVRAAGYIDFTTTVNMSENRTINAQLQPANARARISIPQAQLDDTNPGALNMVTVFVDGRPQVGSPFEIPPGRHTVRVRNGGMVVDIVQDFQPGRSYVIVPNFSATIQAD